MQHATGKKLSLHYCNVNDIDNSIYSLSYLTYVTKKEPRGDGWHPFHAGHGINTNQGYCRVCQEHPSEAEDNPTDVNCTACRFSFHQDCINPPLQVIPVDWRCWCCILEDHDLPQTERNSAEDNWRDMINPT